MKNVANQQRPPPLPLSLISIALCAIMHGTVLPEPDYAPAGDGAMDTMFSFFVGISTITFLFGVQSVAPDIQASLSDKYRSPSKEVWLRGWSYKCLLLYVGAHDVRTSLLRASCATPFRGFHVRRVVLQVSD